MIGQISRREYGKQGDYRWNHYDKIEEQRCRKENAELIRLKEKAMEE